jgi:RNAse (barnase) inhibitor barstar
MTTTKLLKILTIQRNMNIQVFDQNGVLMSNCPSDMLVAAIRNHFNILNSDYIEIHLSGENSQTISDFLNEISSKMQFPDYFGKNFNALNDCLSDLDWLEFRGLCIFIEETDSFLCKEPDKTVKDVIKMFSAISNEWKEPVHLGEVWDRDSVPVHFIFRETKERLITFDLPTVEA